MNTSSYSLKNVHGDAIYSMFLPTVAIAKQDSRGPLCPRLFVAFTKVVTRPKYDASRMVI